MFVTRKIQKIRKETDGAAPGRGFSNLESGDRLDLLVSV